MMLLSKYTVKQPKMLAGQNRRPVLIGLVLAGVTVAVLMLFSKEKAVELAALLLAVIAAIYIGFSLSDGRKPLQQQEISVAVLFIIVALLGMWVSPWFLMMGFLGHGVWDWLHHTNHLQTDVTTWYPPFCAAYDLGVGVGFFYLIF